MTDSVELVLVLLASAVLVVVLARSLHLPPLGAGAALLPVFQRALVGAQVAGEHGPRQFQALPDAHELLLRSRPAPAFS